MSGWQRRPHDDISARSLGADVPGSPKKRARREAEARALQEARERGGAQPRHGELLRPHSAPRVLPATSPRPRQPGEATPYQIVRATVMLHGRAVPVEIGIPGKVLDQLGGGRWHRDADVADWHAEERGRPAPRAATERGRMMARRDRVFLSRDARKLHHGVTRRIREEQQRQAEYLSDDDAPELGGRDVDLMAARGELNLRTWLDD